MSGKVANDVGAINPNLEIRRIPIEGLEQYGAGSDGHVYRFHAGRKWTGWRVLQEHYHTPPRSLKKYARVGLMSSLTAKKVKQGVHRFVAAAWIGPTEGMEVHHKNGDPLDNRPSNLVIVTPNEHTELHRGGDVAGPGVPRVKAEKDLGSTSDWEDIV